MLKDFHKATKRFEELVETGIVTKIDNRKLSIEDAHLKLFSINNR